MKGNGPAVLHTGIDVFAVRILQTKIAPRQSEVRVGHCNGNPHDAGNGHYFIGAGYHTRARSSLPRYNSLGVGATSGETAAPTIRTGKGIVDGKNFRIHIDIKYLGSRRQSGTDD